MTEPHLSRSEPGAESANINHARRLGELQDLSPATDYTNARDYYGAAQDLITAGEVDLALNILERGLGFGSTGRSATRQIPGTVPLEFRTLQMLLASEAAASLEPARRASLYQQVGFHAKSPEVGENEKAVEYLQQAAEAWKNAGRLDNAAGAFRALAQLLENIGDLAYAREIAAESVRYADQGVQQRLDSGLPADIFMVRGTRATLAHLLHTLGLRTPDLNERNTLFQQADRLFLEAEAHHHNKAEPDFARKDNGLLTGLPGAHCVLFLLDKAGFAQDRDAILADALARADNGILSAIVRRSDFNEALDTVMKGLCLMAKGRLLHGEALVERGSRQVTAFGRADLLQAFEVERRVQEYQASRQEL